MYIYLYIYTYIYYIYIYIYIYPYKYTNSLICNQTDLYYSVLIFAMSLLFIGD